jgi:protein SCO1
MLKKPSISLVVAVVLLVPLTVFALVHWAETKGKALPVYTGENHTVTDFSLQNQYGQRVSRKDWKGKIVVADFFFTNCPVICPKMTENLKKVKAAFPEEQALLFNSFSVDPVRDSVAQLKRFAERFGIGENWHLLTGEKAVIYHLARHSFSVAPTEGDGGESDFIHSDKLVLLDAQQRIRGYYSGTTDTDMQRLINDIKKLHNEK